MLHVNDLSFRHGERVLFDRASAAISDGWEVGLVGRNGAGKSTLLRLILDEPSNHLDLEAQLWLTEHLQRFRHTLLMVSHDRDLLNDVCDHIVHIDQQKLVAYNGNYDRFERTRAERLEHDAAQQAKIA